MAKPRSKALSSGLTIPRRWAIFSIATLLFVLSQFYRASIAVITPQLMADLALDAGGLSLATSMFFYAFALVQIPIGLSLDRIGARITMFGLSLVGVAGALLFAAANSLEQLILARILMGVGMACNLMGTFKLLTLWFGPARFATLTGLVFSIGTVGSIVATTPLVLLVQLMGWRSSFLVFAAVNLVLAVTFFIVVRDRPPGVGPVNQASESLRTVARGLFQLLRLRDYWIISLGTFCHYGIFAAIQTLWAGPYLMRVMGLPAVTTGNVIFLLNLGFILGGPAFGALSDRWLRSRKKVVVCGIAVSALVLTAMAKLPGTTSALLLAGFFFAFGLSRSAGSVMYAHIKERMPLELAGTAMTGINFFTMIGAAAFLHGTGALMQHLYGASALTAPAFETVYLLCAALLAVMALLYLWTKDTLRR